MCLCKDLWKLLNYALKIYFVEEECRGIFRLNAGIVTVQTLYRGANTPLTLKWTAS